MSLTCTMILGNCLEVMPELPVSFAQMCFADLPYALSNTPCTRNDWDKHVPLEDFWPKLWRLMGQKASAVLTCNARLMASLISNDTKKYRYDLVYLKSNAVGFLDASRRPLRAHENIAVFSVGAGVYRPQKTKGVPYTAKRQGRLPNYDETFGQETVSDGWRFPLSYLGPFVRDRPGLHPTQKPVALLSWIVRTYSDPGDNVLDPVSGSFTTCVSACLNGRNSVGIEKDPGYFEAGVERVRKTVRDNNLDVKVEVRR